MRLASHLAPIVALRSIDWVGIIFGMVLSLACLVRGAVDDSVIALLLLGCLPILFVVLRSKNPSNPELEALGMLFFIGFILVLGLQYAAADIHYPFWPHAQALTANPPPAMAFYSTAAMAHGIGRFLFFTITFIIALAIGSHESSARIFLISLLISGTACLSLTFFLTRGETLASSTLHSYRHGFVNANNAATYLGVMALLGLAQTARFLRCPTKSMTKMLLDFIDQLSVTAIIQWGFLLFSLLLVFTGLLMTASRGGIVLSLFCSALLVVTIVMKVDVSADRRRLLLGLCLIVATLVLFWCFINYGQQIAHKLQTDGSGANSRFDIFAAVMPMIGDHPLLGTGIDSFPAAFQHYRPTTLSSDGIIDKAHNSYLEFAAEMGLPLLLLLMGVLGRIGFLLARGVKQRKERYVLPALGLAVWLLAALHSLIDFPLQIPGLAAVFIAVTIVCVCQTDPRFCEPAHSTTSSRKRVRLRKRRGSKQI